MTEDVRVRCSNCEDTGWITKVLSTGKVVYLRCFRCQRT